MADFIPTQDAQFKHFAVAFATAISSAPSAYMLGSGDVNLIEDTVQRYVDALAVATNKMTRTEPTVNAKDTARNLCRNLLRRYANQFRANMGISDAELINVGVRRRPDRLGRRSCPGTSPALGFVATTPGCDTLTYSDALDFGRTSKKPHGAERLELFVAYLDGPPTQGLQPPDDAKYVRSYRKSPMVVPHDPKHRGQPATYWGRWAGFNDDVGPWSLSVSLGHPGAAASETMQTKSKGGPKHDAPPLRIEGEMDEEPRKKAA